MNRGVGLALLLAAAVPISAPPAITQETPPAKTTIEPWAQFDQTSLSLRGSLWSHSRSLDGETSVGSASAWASGRLRLGEGAKAVYDGWVRNDRLGDGGATQGEVREAYLAGSAGNWDFAAGRQLIVWGKADAVNPTDVLSVRDFTLLTPLDEDQKSGVGALKATYNLDDLRLSAIALPEFRAGKLPLPRTPGVRFSERDPANPWRQFALRAERSAGLSLNEEPAPNVGISPDRFRKIVHPRQVEVGHA